MTRKRIVRIPKEGVPRPLIPETPDSVLCKRIRIGFVTLSTALYFLVLFGWIFGLWKISITEAGSMGLMALLSPVVADTVIRPGKGLTWFYALVSVMVLFFFPSLWILIPVGLIFYLIIQNLRHH